MGKITYKDRVLAVSGFDECSLVRLKIGEEVKDIPLTNGGGFISAYDLPEAIERIEVEVVKHTRIIEVER